MDLSDMYLDQLSYQTICREEKLMVVCRSLERGVFLKISWGFEVVHLIEVKNQKTLIDSLVSGLLISLLIKFIFTNLWLSISVFGAKRFQTQQWGWKEEV